MGSVSGGDFAWLNDLWNYNPATLEWTWVSGSSMGDQVGVYGTQGTAAASNVPGARTMAVSWIDSSGKLWLFGGFGYDSSGWGYFLNDLWNYNPATLKWTWVSGSNMGNQVGVYGAQGTAAALDVPGARESAASWIDSSGKLWLFGGVGFDSSGVLNELNDLWKYDPATLEWTWVSGNNSAQQAGVYGTKGTGAPSNVPGARESAVSWIDSSSKLWLFGGVGRDSAENSGFLNDLWQYTR